MVQANAARRLRVLFADDEPHLRELVHGELTRLGHQVTVCPDGVCALKALEKGTYDAAILDIRMPGMSGLEVLTRLKQVAPHTEAILLTGYASLESAVEALRLGAFEYITKPCKLAELEAVLRRVAEKKELTMHNLALQRRVRAAEGPTVLIGESPAMQQVRRLIATIAPTDATVLILGETGTGKELVARLIFEQSRRAHMPFVPVNCGALSENLAESELFGHRKGAFTGADRDHKGLFEVANGGTLFLDEVGELSKNIQVKLLRFLESGEIRRVGETEPFRTDVRVLCATNRNLREMVAHDEFREDLYFRINTFEIQLPALRERRCDIPELARHLLARAARRPVEQVAEMLRPDTLDALLEHDWPGNVRELANVMEHAWIVSGGGTITPEHLPRHVGQRGASFSFTAVRQHGPGEVSPPRTLREVEMEHVLRVLEKHGGNKPAAAAELGISLKTLYNKLHQLEAERKQAG
ncbi:MAG: sigma-54 dependent transcriptional regulator [Gemmatales bacterium]|nr:sigma-54 dependent transcriptional regulator [Gemmatales bacterium]MDW8176505.1 sigma-54 dependent transcriptional regulator [Gemmatales bacterium]